MRFHSLLTLSLASACIAVPAVAEEQAKKGVDMSDPTAVYSSVGTSFTSEGNVDLSAGFAWGKNLLSIETKNGADAINARYAWMTDGRGVYGEAYFNHETDTVSGSVGYIHTFKVHEKVKLYPLAMVGFNDNDITDTMLTGTIGMYTRVDIGSGFHLGLDPFYTVGEGDYDSHSVDTFVGKQVDNHRVRVGINSADEELYFKWQMAF
ncbi:hypothetical protein J4N42_19345 [Vibrio sp. SCSIO 43135]|uniref:hypothetical protein n=1 Tax=Vibrio sp. SCSIO 43135 TaxID=2819096 RepID=UPI002075E627|nr:hypothetical protein [Vibrio sp. SCSIO 43135]USD42776.1 hypothetical protein J4N42_19345 [Vibrio sp. SCSIO 43135]